MRKCRRSLEKFPAPPHVNNINSQHQARPKTTLRRQSDHKIYTMKVITVNFLTCAVKACRASPASTPLHFKDAELEQQELDFNPSLIRNILPRIDWDSLKTTAQELGFPDISNIKPSDEQIDETMLRDLHKLLMETHVIEGKLCCANCGHEYQIKEGIANFLLPSHLV